MKNRVNALLVLFVVPQFCVMSIAQNRIQNGGFEYRNSSSPASRPNHTGQVGDADVWVDQIRCFTWISTVTEEEHSCGRQLHSPDWWSTDIVEPGLTDNLKFPFRQNVPSVSGWVIVHPTTGKHYVGMGTGELFQQQLTTANKLEPGRTFYLKFKLRLLGSAGQYIQQVPMVIFSHAYLKVFLSVKRLQYKNNDYEPGILDTEEYWEKKNAFDQHIIEIASINLSPQNYPYPHDAWHDVVIEFVAPEDWT